MNNQNERKLVPIKLDGYKPLRDVVFETLRDAIIRQVLKPGERLMEIQLADEMGVSRTPVREAIRKLELEGLVVMVPRKGAYVAGVSMKDIHEVYEVRSALEMLAVTLAAERITDEELDALERQVLRESEEERTAVWIILFTLIAASMTLFIRLPITSVWCSLSTFCRNSYSVSALHRWRDRAEVKLPWRNIKRL